MNKHFPIFFLLLIFTNFCNAQRTQTIKGIVADKESHTALSGVVIAITNLQTALEATTNDEGDFSIQDVPVGKQNLRITYLGYQPVYLYNVLVTSAKEVVLNIEMEESASQTQEVVVSGKKEQVNEMALVSTKPFDVQETERYAGSRADPARMASNFAGVQGGDDSRNDIVIRGNSPQGLLWRLNDIDIPNPNHFAIPGTSGGPVSMLNNKTLGNSEFFTGAFPAEFGNTTAGVFDLKMRNGNKERYEITAQLGILGTELSAEGPISKKHGSSFLFAYRYSTLRLFEGLHIKIGTNSVPSYQDLNFKLNFPVGKKGNFSLFGIGGLSSIDLIVSNLKKPSEEIYGEADRDQYFTSNTGIIVVAYAHTINKTAFTKFTLAVSGNEIKAHHDKVFREANFTVDSLKDILDYNFGTTTVSAHWYLNKKISLKHIFKLGLVNDLFLLNLLDSSRQYPPTRQDWQHRLDFEGTTDLIQGYVQYKFRPSEAFSITIGLHAQYLTHNHSKSIEPRAAMRYKIGHADVVSLGYGLHSQMQALYQYFAYLPQYPASAMHNYNIDFTKSHHIVAGYEHNFPGGFSIHTEAYYQYLFNVPIEIKPGSSFSAIDQGAVFSRYFPDTLQNKGTGYNYGIEITVSRRFKKGYYFLFTGTLFNSKAKGNDGIYRNTDYNGNFAANLLAGYEKRIGKYSTLITGAKITYSGGKLYSPPNVAASNTLGDFVIIDSARNTLRFPDYFRTDAKLGLRINAKKLTHEIGIDLVNILGTKNILSLTYSSDLASQGQYPFYKEYQLSFLPLFYYRIDFGFGK